MTVALIGLIGVVLGALLGGFVSLAIERRRELSRARVSQRLIVAELEVAQARIGSAKTAQRWWSKKLPTKQWEAHRSDLALRVSDQVQEKLKDAYLLIEGLNTIRGNRPREVAELETDQTALRLATDALRRDDLRLSPFWFLRSPVTGRIAAARVFGLAVALAVVLVAAQTPYDDLNPTTVAAGLQAQLGDGTMVDCSQDGTDWSCVENDLSSPRAVCQTATSSASTQQLVAAPPSVSPPSAACRVTGDYSWRAFIGSDRIEYVPTPEEIVLGGAKARLLSEPTDTRNLLQRFLDLFSRA